MHDLIQYSIHFRRFYQKSFQPLGERLGLSQLEMDLLLFLRNNPEQNTARDAAALRGFAKSNVSMAVERLAGEGWLRVEPDPVSRRVKRLFLENGRRRDIDELAECQEKCFAAILADFTPLEREGLRELMDRLDANVKSALAELEQ